MGCARVYRLAPLALRRSGSLVFPGTWRSRWCRYELRLMHEAFRIVAHVCAGLRVYVLRSLGGCDAQRCILFWLLSLICNARPPALNRLHLDTIQGARRSCRTCAVSPKAVCRLCGLSAQCEECPQPRACVGVERAGRNQLALWHAALYEPTSACAAQVGVFRTAALHSPCAQWRLRATLP